MRLLLDTNVVLRLLEGEGRLDREARRFIANAKAVYVSAASIWEIAIKTSARKLDVDIAHLERGLLAAGMMPLAVSWTHALRSYDIAAAHPDPFDRLLLAQAVCEPLHLLTTDERLAEYGRDLVLMLP